MTSVSRRPGVSATVSVASSSVPRGQLAQALQRQQRVRRVVEHARAPHDVVRADRGDRRGLVQVALHEAHLRVAPRDLGAEAVGRAHDVDAGDARGAGVLGGEAQRAVDRPHAADVDERAARRVAGDELLARRRRRAEAGAHARGGGEGAAEHGRAEYGVRARALRVGYRAPPATGGAVGSAPSSPGASRARYSSASSGFSRARWTTFSRSFIEATSSICSLMNHCMNCSLE